MLAQTWANTQSCCEKKPGSTEKSYHLNLTLDPLTGFVIRINGPSLDRIQNLLPCRYESGAATWANACVWRVLSAAVLTITEQRGIRDPALETLVIIAKTAAEQQKMPAAFQKLNAGR
jgi:hypothetical protein